MKQLPASKKSRVILGLTVVIIVAGLAIWWMYIQQHAAWKRDVLKKTDVADYSELSKNDLNNRSKALFGKTADDLAETEIKKSNGDASAKEAAKIMAAAGKIDKSIEAFNVAEKEQGETVDQDLYREYRNALDEAGRHSEATELMRRELERLKKETPRDEIAIVRVESQIAEREEYYR